MTDFDNGGEVVKSQIDIYLDERMQWMGDAVELFTGDRNYSPLEVFPAAPEVRADGLAVVTIDGEARAITEEEAPKLREIAGRFGIGGETDVLSRAQFAVIEGGKIWKVESEIAITEEAEALVLAGSSKRVVGQDEVDYAREKFGIDLSGSTEYDMVRMLIDQYEDLVPLAQEKILPFGYEVAEGNPVVEEYTGQLVEVGEKSDKPVYLLRVDREDYVDEDGKNKYRYQPDSARLMQLVIESMGDVSVGIVTSNTYASRAIDVVRAGLQRQAQFDVGMYGRQTIANVRGIDVAEPTELKQIPGEMNTIYGKLLKLQVELENVKD